MLNYENGLFIFRRDFRILDNIGLLTANKECKRIYCCFIFTPEQVTGANKYKSDNAVQFMIETLKELKTEIAKSGGELMCFYGKNKEIVNHLIKELDIDAVYYNRDYTPYALERDKEIRTICEKVDVKVVETSDYYLHEPGTIQTGSKSYYKKYTPFQQAFMHMSEPDAPNNTRITKFTKTTKSLSKRISLEKAHETFVSKNNENILVHGGRTNALQRLRHALNTQSKYEEKRDTLTYETTFLSAYIKFGCVSVREVYHAVKRKFGKSSGIIRELIWREFFAHVLFAFPEVVGKSYQEKYRAIEWSRSKTAFDKWCAGKTGVPIVDAGMRQLNKTGYMHNRVRMMTASFLVKTLLIDWRWGEQYFAKKLTDYDLASNNGNWQGISGTGVDMKPYFRDMNPYIQTRKFDSDAEYVKKWVPELADVPATDIHNWFKTHEKHKSSLYPKPMVDYDVQKEKMLELYRKHS